MAGYLNDTVWINKHPTTGTKARIYKSTIRPIMRYTAEIEADTTKTQRLVKTKEIRLLQKVTNKMLRGTMGSQEIIDIC